jgi:hypothetical protein
LTIRKKDEMPKTFLVRKTQRGAKRVIADKKAHIRKVPKEIFRFSLDSKTVDFFAALYPNLPRNTAVKVFLQNYAKSISAPPLTYRIDM